MSAEYMHIGIPVLNKKPGMVYNEWGGFWVNQSVDEYDYKIEYLKFEEGTRFPEILSKQPHVAYKVDDMTPYVEKAERVIFGRDNRALRGKIRSIHHSFLYPFHMKTARSNAPGGFCFVGFCLIVRCVYCW